MLPGLREDTRAGGVRPKPRCPHLKDRAVPRHAMGSRDGRLPGPLPGSDVCVCLTVCRKAARLQPS